MLSKSVRGFFRRVFGLGKPTHQPTPEPNSTGFLRDLLNALEAQPKSKFICNHCKTQFEAQDPYCPNCDGLYRKA